MASLRHLCFTTHTSLHQVGAFKKGAAHFSSWEVSSLGRVKNTRGLISWGSLRSDGYRAINLTVEGVRISSRGEGIDRGHETLRDSLGFACWQLLCARDEIVQYVFWQAIPPDRKNTCCKALA